VVLDETLDGFGQVFFGDVVVAAIDPDVVGFE
jgi:hypothetical protein